LDLNVSGKVTDGTSHVDGLSDCWVNRVVVSAIWTDGEFGISVVAELEIGSESDGCSASTGCNACNG